MKFTNEVFEDFTDGAEFYRHKGSLWLIFTNQKKWIFELSKEGVLWYNYYFFDKIFKFFSMDLIENQKFITEWVEDTIQNGVKHTARAPNSAFARVEYTIQNGVKHTDACQIGTSTSIEDTIQNGVKDTHKLKLTPYEAIEDAIQNGVKETVSQLLAERIPIEDTIQNGVKQTHLGGKDRKIDEIKDIIENGLKETTPGGYLGSVEMKGTMVHQFESPKQNNELEDTIQNGVKETNPHFLEILNPINFEPSIKEIKRMNEVHIVLENGIKEVKELPDKNGELKGYGEYYQSQEDITKPHTQYVNDVLKDGINETNWRCVDNHPTFVDNVLTSGIKEIWGYAQQPKIRVDEVIQSGVQEDLS